jgi:excisionase family DNA binding protein
MGDVKGIAWIAEQLGISLSTAYRLAENGGLTQYGAFKIGAQWRVSVPRFMAVVHQTPTEQGTAA